MAVGGTTQPNIWHVFYLQSALHTNIVQHNFAFRAMVPSTGKPRVLAASSKTTVHHGATTLTLVSIPLLSECVGGRHNRHGGVHTRVCASLIEKRGDFVVSHPISPRFRRVKKISLAVLLVHTCFLQQYLGSSSSWFSKQRLVMY